MYLFINFAKRPGSLTEQAPIRVPDKKNRKSVNYTTNKNENILEMTKKEMEMQKQNWGGHR